MAKLNNDGQIPQNELDAINDQFRKLGLTKNEVDDLNRQINEKNIIQIEQTK